MHGNGGDMRCKVRLLEKIESVSLQPTGCRWLGSANRGGEYETDFGVVLMEIPIRVGIEGKLRVLHAQIV